MRKGKLVLLAGAFALAAVVPVSAPAVDRAGVGLDWGMGPNLVAGNFKMEFAQAFALSWKVSDSFTVAVFNDSAPWRAEFSYTSETPADTAKHKYMISKDGTVSVSGIRILHTVPGLDFIQAGIEFGSVAMTENAAIYKQDGINGAFGGAFGGVAAMPAQANLLGVSGKVSIFKAESKTVTTDINVTGSFRIINMPETDVLGTSKLLLNTPKSIDPVTSYNNLQVLLGVGLWF